MRFPICNELFEGWEFERVSRYVKSVGYDAIEVPLRSLRRLPT